jgi:hypothetical protein
MAAAGCGARFLSRSYLKSELYFLQSRLSMEIAIINADITQIAADLIVMKHADGFYGADRVIADVIGFNKHIRDGASLYVSAKTIGAPEVLFIGVGPLNEFRYEKIQAFGSAAVALARDCKRRIAHMALTLHGPGYGLDPEQSFLSMIAGIVAKDNCRRAVSETM